MKQGGVIREVDSLGRVVIPKYIRNELKILPEDKLSIYRDGSRIAAEKYSSALNGISRGVDALGRIVIPKTMRNEFDLPVGSRFLIYREESRIIIEKYSPFCIFCGSEENTVEFNKKQICVGCIKKIKSL